MWIKLLILIVIIHISNGQVGKKYKVEGVDIEILQLPTNCTVKSKKGDYLTTDYIGTFLDGKKFDSTYDRKEPMSYIMGNGDVIKGCEIGTMNMCKGEKRHIIIPPHLAYGDKDYAQIPGGSTLQFDIVLTELQDNPFEAIMKRASAFEYFKK